MTLKAVVFDLDGTLLDTLDDLADAANAGLERLGFPGHDADAYRYFIGDGIATLARRVLPPDRDDPATVEACAELIKAEYSRRWDVKTRPYEGIAEVLDALSTRGVPMAVLSNKPHDMTILCVTRLLAGWDFAAVIGASPAFPRKPDPSGALHVAAQLGAAPAEIVYLGDTATDMQTALAAGMFAAGACWGFRTPEELRENGAEVLLEKPQELLRLLGADK